MKAYMLYKDKSIKGFRHLINSGPGVFDSYRTLAVKFIKYASGDLDNNLAKFDEVLQLDKIKLEKVFPAKYRWFISDVSLRNSRNYLKQVEERITEFQGKEDNLKIMAGMLFLKLVVITKIVETYCSSMYNMKVNNIEVSDMSLDSIGINNQVLKYYNDFQDIGKKSIDDWLGMSIDSNTANYFYSSMKRILKILMSTMD